MKKLTEQEQYYKRKNDKINARRAWWEKNGINFLLYPLQFFAVLAVAGFLFFFFSAGVWSFGKHMDKTIHPEDWKKCEHKCEPCKYFHTEPLDFKIESFKNEWKDYGTNLYIIHNDGSISK